MKLIVHDSYKVMRYPIIGFFIAFFTLLSDIWFDYSQMLFHTTTKYDHLILTSILMIITGVPILWLMKRQIDKITYLKDFARVCAWCNKVKVEDEWMMLDKYLSNFGRKKTTHGICPQCSEDFRKNKDERAKNSVL